MSIALYTKIAIVVAYVFAEVAGVVIELFVTSVSKGVTDSAEKAGVVIVVSVLDETLAVFNLVGPVLSIKVPYFEAWSTLIPYVIFIILLHGYSVLMKQY